MLNPKAGTVPPFMLTDYQNTFPLPKFFWKINDIDCLPARAQWDKIEFLQNIILIEWVQFINEWRGGKRSLSKSKTKSCVHFFCTLLKLSWLVFKKSVSNQKIDRCIILRMMTKKTRRFCKNRKNNQEHYEVKKFCVDMIWPVLPHCA